MISDTFGLRLDLVDVMGNDLTVVNAARASFSKEKAQLDQKDEQLIDYLWRNKHTTPFRHPQLSLRVTAPIFLARQLVKHQVGMSWSEESRRYITDTPQIWRNPVWHKRPEESIKQGSGEQVSGDVSLVADTLVEKVCRDAVDAYERLLFMGVAPEEARIVLPLATCTTWVWTGSLLSFINIYLQRGDEHAQLIARKFAQMLHNVLTDHFPLTMNAVEKHCG